MARCLVFSHMFAAVTFSNNIAYLKYSTRCLPKKSDVCEDITQHMTNIEPEMNMIYVWMN